MDATGKTKMLFKKVIFSAEFKILHVPLKKTQARTTFIQTHATLFGCA
jgi:hypothetical protein